MSDPYVKVYLLPEGKQKYETKIKYKNLSPIFNETFSFNVSFNDQIFQFFMWTGILRIVTYCGGVHYA